MNIVFTIDRMFVEHMTVTIASILLKAHASDAFTFYIVESDITEDDKHKILDLKKIKDFEVKFIRIDNDKYKKFPTIGHFKPANYYRISLPSLLKNVDKVLYLDCDILIRKSLSKFFKMSFDNTYALVVDDSRVGKDLFPNQIKNLGLNKYFNSGVMMLNLKKMREDNIEEKCFEFIKKYPKKIKCVDQCVFNYVFKGNVKFIEDIYNIQYNPSLKYIVSRYKDMIKNCVVFHLTSECKPWIVGKYHPYKIKYYYYLSKTAYKKNSFCLLFDEIKAYLSFERPLVFRKLYLSCKYILKHINIFSC